MSESTIQTRTVQVAIAKDVPSYMTHEIQVPEAIIRAGAGYLDDYIREAIIEADREGDLTSFDPEWENSSQLRIISVTEEASQQLLRSGSAIEPAYWDISHDLIDLVRSHAAVGEQAVPMHFLLDILRRSKVDI